MSYGTKGLVVAVIGITLLTVAIIGARELGLPREHVYPDSFTLNQGDMVDFSTTTEVVAADNNPFFLEKDLEVEAPTEGEPPVDYAHDTYYVYEGELSHGKWAMIQGASVTVSMESGHKATVYQDPGKVVALYIILILIALVVWILIAISILES